MAIINTCKKAVELLIAAANVLQHLFLLAIRLYWGWAFHLAGCTKFEKIEGVTAFFQSLAIPFPETMAYLVASLECIGGLLLIFGLASRLISLPLAVTMAVALLTAHAEGALQLFSDPSKFVAQAPVTYLLASLTIFLFGPGRLSIDAAIKYLFTRKKKALQ